MNETSSTYPENISFRQCTAISDDWERDYAALGERNCTRVSGEAMVPPILSKRLKYPEFPTTSKNASGSPTACQEHLGGDGVSKDCSCLKVTSLFPRPQ